MSVITGCRCHMYVKVLEHKTPVRVLQNKICLYRERECVLKTVSSVLMAVFSVYLFIASACHAYFCEVRQRA